MPDGESWSQNCAGAEAKAVLYRTYLCEFWELSVQIYVSIDLMYDNIHLSSAVVPSDRPQVAYQKSIFFLTDVRIPKPSSKIY